MNPAQPPEGILDPQKPYWPADKVGEATWLRLKGNLTGRRVEGLSENFTSYVKLGDADADKLIENLKKWGKYPQLNQKDKSGGAYNAEAYQKWLVEEFLEKPFRQQVDEKIEEAAIQSRLKELDEIKKQLNPKKVEEVEPQQTLVNNSIIEDPWAGSYVPSSEIQVVSNEESKPVLLLPPPKDEPSVPPMEVEPEKLKIPQVKSKTKKTYDLSPISLPEKLPQELRKNFSLIGKQLDGISRELSAQTILLRRKKFKIRKLSEQLSAIEEIIQNQIENYQEAIDDLETQKRISEFYSAPIGPQPMDSSTPWAETQPGEAGDEQGYTPRLQSTKLSQGGFLNTPYPAGFSMGGVAYPGTPLPGLAEGGISIASDITKNVLQPGVYDDPTRGYLPPGSVVIPENRNTGREMLNLYDYKQYQTTLLKSLSIPLQAAIAATAAKIGETVRGLGIFAEFFGLNVENLSAPLASILGISKVEARKILNGDENYRDEFVGLWPSIMKLKNWIFGGGKDKSDGSDVKYEGQVFPGVAFIKSIDDLAYAGGTNVGRLPAWIPIPQAYAKKVGYTSGFGFRWFRQHQGIDLDGTPDIPIISPFSGKVSMVDDDTQGGGYGKYVEVEHDQPKIFTFYAHLSKIASGIQVGAPIQPGQELGKMGNTGRGTGVHLHWEVRESSGHASKRINPVDFTHSVQAGGPPRRPTRNPMDYPEWQVTGSYDEGQIVRFGRPNPKLYKIKNGDIDWSSEGKFESGGTVITVDNRSYFTKPETLQSNSKQRYKIKSLNSQSSEIISLVADRFNTKKIEEISRDFKIVPVDLGEFIIPLESYKDIKLIYKSIEAPARKPVNIGRPNRPTITTDNLKEVNPEVYTRIQQFQTPSISSAAPAKSSPKIIRNAIPTAAVQKCIHERRL